MRGKRVIGFALVLAAAGTVQSAAAQEQPRAHGQHQGHGEARAQRGPFGRLLRGIELTDRQKEQLRAVMAEGRPNRGEARGDRRGEGRPNRGEVRGERRQPTAEQRARMQQRREQQFQRIRAVLTAEQRVQFDRNVREMEANRAQRGNREGATTRVPR